MRPPCQMKLRAFDCHTHCHTGDRRKQQDEKRNDASRLFGSAGATHGESNLEYYRSRRIMAVVFDVDAETNTGLRIDNREIVDLVNQSDGLFLGFGSVDPWKGKVALRQIEECHKMGLKGIKLMPITQAFFINDQRFYPLWDACQSLGLPLVVHAGTTAIGNNSPGGRGLHLKYSHPLTIDDVAADFPRLTIIAAHPGWPWHLDLLAVARHKGNVFIDLSGWAPKYFPTETVQYLNSMMPDKFVFGSDFPLLTPDRWLDDFSKLPIKDAVRKMVLYENACRIFGVDPNRFELEG